MDLLLALFFSLLAIILALPIFTDWRLTSRPSTPPPPPQPRGYRLNAEEEPTFLGPDPSRPRPPTVRPRHPPRTIHE